MKSLDHYLLWSIKGKFIKGEFCITFVRVKKLLRLRTFHNLIDMLESFWVWFPFFSDFFLLLLLDKRGGKRASQSIWGFFVFFASYFWLWKKLCSRKTWLIRINTLSLSTVIFNSYKWWRYSFCFIFSLNLIGCMIYIWWYFRLSFILTIKWSLFS